MLGKLHQHGYHHGDFRERKVVVKDENTNLSTSMIYMSTNATGAMGWTCALTYCVTRQLQHFRVMCYSWLALICVYGIIVSSSICRTVSHSDVLQANKPMIKVYGEKVYATEYPPQEIVDELIADRASRFSYEYGDSTWLA